MASPLRQLTSLTTLACALVACSPGPGPVPGTLPPATPPPAHQALLGHFADDYAIVHSISDILWTVGSRDQYRIVRWNDSARYLIAQNAEGNVADAGRWTRIDWVLLPAMPPYDWAFCMIEYKAETSAAAESNHSADGANPRKGCNGFPFSRMRRISADSIDPKPYQ